MIQRFFSSFWGLLAFYLAIIAFILALYEAY